MTGGADHNAPPVRRHRYPPPVLVADGARAVAGLAVCGGLLALPVVPWLAAALAGGVALFGWFGLRTGLRLLTVVESDDQGVRLIGPVAATLRWNELSRLKLRYYSTRRDRRNGWMELSLTGRGRSVRLESTLDGFDDIAAAAAGAAGRRRLTLDDGTIGNFLALGIDPGPAAGQETGP